jgi:UDPglucose 6-dehydrogenase
VHDPKAMDKAKSLLPPAPNIAYFADMNEAVDGCDAVVVATEWPEFRKLDLERARKTMTHPIMFDGRNLFDPNEMEQIGFVYKSIGRK